MKNPLSSYTIIFRRILCAHYAIFYHSTVYNELTKFDEVKKMTTVLACKNTYCAYWNHNQSSFKKNAASTLR